jgi:hypothetical protein
MSHYFNDLVGLYDPSTEPKTNLQRWLCYMQDAEAPNAFIVSSFYSCISAALQRRVWKTHSERLCYPNTYTILISPPGIGKGRTIDLPFKMLSGFFWDGKALPSLREDGTPYPDDTATFQAQETTLEKLESLQEELIRQQLLDSYANKNKLSDDLIFPMPANSSSLRALTTFTARSLRNINFYAKKKDGNIGKGVYSHNSVYVVLPEFGSLFKDRRETSDIVTFLNEAWDAGSYKHSTSEHGCDEIQRICVTMIGGTTQPTIKKLFGGGLLDQGLSARALFVFDDTLRFRYYPDEKELRPIQVKAYQDLRKHVRQLAHVYGPVTFTDECRLYLKPWWEDHFEETRINKNPRLDFYYARKLVHVLKLAMAVHFSEKLDRFVTLPEVITAMEFLNAIEVNMHLALQMDSRSDTGATIRKLQIFINRQKEPIGLIRLYAEFIDEVNSMTELKELLVSMTEAKLVRSCGDGKYYRVEQQVKQEKEQTNERNTNRTTTTEINTHMPSL